MSLTSEMLWKTETFGHLQSDHDDQSGQRVSLCAGSASHDLELHTTI